MNLKERSFNVSCQPLMSKAEQRVFEIEKARIDRERVRSDKELSGKLNDREKKIYLIARIVAETDSIGEGYSYCSYYSIKHFNNLEDNEYRSVAEEIYEVAIG